MSKKLVSTSAERIINKFERKISKLTKAKYIISDEKYLSKIRNYCSPIVVSNVLKSVYDVALLFYPNSLDDAVDFDVVPPNTQFYNSVKFGNKVKPIITTHEKSVIRIILLNINSYCIKNSLYS